MALVTPIERRKLLALALCSLLPAGAPPVMDRINPLLLNVVETLHDVSRPDDGGDSLLVAGPAQLADDGEPEYETAHDVRRRALTATDPVHTQVPYTATDPVHAQVPYTATGPVHTQVPY